jgi:transposase
MRWVQRYEQEGNTKRHNRYPVAYEVTKEHVKFLLTEVKNNPTITVDDLHLEFKKKFQNANLSRVHIGRIVRDNNHTLKRKRLRHEPILRYGKDVDIKKNLKEFYDTVKQYSIDDMICIDETSLNSFMVRKYCREKIGKRCTMKTYSQEVFKKFTGIFAISTRGCVGYHVYDSGGINSERLIEFLGEHVLPGRRNKVIVLDNASSHRNPDVKSKIQHDNTLLYSVPYQHYTNAIENFFSVLKFHMQKEKPIGREAIIRAIDNALTKITPTKYRNFFKNAYERSKDYKRNKSTRVRPLKNYK